jgi:hypothetical protein
MPPSIPAVVAAAPADLAPARGTPVLHAPWLQKACPDPELRQGDARDRRQGRESREVGDGVHGPSVPRRHTWRIVRIG